MDETKKVVIVDKKKREPILLPDALRIFKKRRNAMYNLKVLKLKGSLGSSDYYWVNYANDLPLLRTALLVNSGVVNEYGEITEGFFYDNMFTPNSIVPFNDVERLNQVMFMFSHNEKNSLRVLRCPSEEDAKKILRCEKVYPAMVCSSYYYFPAWTNRRNEGKVLGVSLFNSKAVEVNFYQEIPLGKKLYGGLLTLAETEDGLKFG